MPDRRNEGRMGKRKRCWIKSGVAQRLPLGSHRPAMRVGTAVCEVSGRGSTRGYVLSLGGQVCPRVAGTARRCRIFEGSRRGYGSKSEKWRYAMPREKIKFALRIMPETQQLVKDIYSLDNCQNQSEFIEKAIHFYAGYVASKNGTEFLAPVLVSALQGTVANAENHIARLLFKLAVETNMMMNVLASEVDVSPEALERLRGRCIQEVKKTGGAVTFADAMKYQHSE